MKMEIRNKILKKMFKWDSIRFIISDVLCISLIGYIFINTSSLLNHILCISSISLYVFNSLRIHRLKDNEEKYFEKLKKEGN